MGLPGLNPGAGTAGPPGAPGRPGSCLFLARGPLRPPAGSAGSAHLRDPCPLPPSLEDW